jgi:monofunctional chorismate mutase
MDQIDVYRKQIDELDNQIMSLLDKRYHLSTKIGTLKQHLKKPVLDTSREKTILDKISNYSHSPQIEVIYKTIMEESRKLQRK